MLVLCLALREKFSIAAVTNDIFTREDAEFLTKNKALPASRIRAIETGGCPHAAVREDISANLAALEDLHREFTSDILLIESGGDNLAANYSRELADYISTSSTYLAAIRFRERGDRASRRVISWLLTRQI